MFISTWVILVAGLVFALPMIYLRVKDHTDLSDEILCVCLRFCYILALDWEKSDTDDAFSSPFSVRMDDTGTVLDTREANRQLRRQGRQPSA
jgi:hypothetical protein